QIATNFQPAGAQRAAETGAIQAELSRNLRVDQINVLQIGRIHEQTATDLQQAGLQGAVDSGAHQAELSRHLRAGQIDLLEPSLVVLVGIHEQIATDL